MFVVPHSRAAWRDSETALSRDCLRFAEHFLLTLAALQCLSIVCLNSAACIRCSCLLTDNRKPEMLHRLSRARTARLPVAGRRLLASTAPLTKWFKDIPSIQYEGPQTKNPLAYRYYDANAVVAGKPMSEWMRAAVCYWHTFRGTSLDIFGQWSRITNLADSSIL